MNPDSAAGFTCKITPFLERSFEKLFGGEFELWNKSNVPCVGAKDHGKMELELPAEERCKGISGARFTVLGPTNINVRIVFGNSIEASLLSFSPTQKKKGAGIFL